MILENSPAALLEAFYAALDTPPGSSNVQAWIQTVKLAKDIGSSTDLAICYLHLCAAYVYAAQSPKMTSAFLQLRKMYKAEPKIFDPTMRQFFAWVHKVCVSVVLSIPTVDVSYCQTLLAELRSFLESNYGSQALRPYYWREYKLHQQFGLTESAQTAYQNWYASQMDPQTADCPPCDASYQVDYYIHREDWSSAAQTIDQINAQDFSESACDNQPEELLVKSLEPLLRTGRDAEAWTAHLRSYQHHQESITRAEYFPLHFYYLGICGRLGQPERLERAIGIFRRHLSWFTTMETPRQLLELCTALTIILESPALDPNAPLKIDLPANWTWIEQTPISSPSISQAAAWFKKAATALAQNFANRPGLPNPQLEFERLKRRINPDLRDVPPLNSPNTSTTSAPQPIYSVSSKTPGSEEKSANFAYISSLAASPHIDNDALEEFSKPNLVKVDPAGPWQKMNYQELQTASAKYGPLYPSIYSEFSLQQLALNPVLAGEIKNIGRDFTLEEAHLILLLDHLVMTHNEKWLEPVWRRIHPVFDIGKQFPQHYQELPRAAVLLLEAEEQIFQAKNYYRAAQLADLAMRTPSPEPLGVRLQALRLLTSAAKKAGFKDECRQTYQELINLCAACGLTYQQIFYSHQLAHEIHAAKQYRQAAILAQNCLDIATDFSPNSPLIAILNLHLATNCLQIRNFPDAIRAWQTAAAIQAVNGQILPSLQSQEQAAQAFFQNNEPDKGISLYSQILKDVQALITSTSGSKTAQEILSFLQSFLPNYAFHLAGQYHNLDSSQRELFEDLLNNYRNLYNPALPSLNQPLQKSTDHKNNEPSATDEKKSPEKIQMYAQAYLTTGHLYAQAELFLEAANAYEQAIHLLEPLDTPLLLAEAYLKNADLAFYLGDLLKARAHYQKVVDLLQDSFYTGHAFHREACTALYRLKSTP